MESKSRAECRWRIAEPAPYRCGGIARSAKICRGAAVALVLGLAACKPATDVPDTGLAGYDPDLVAREEAACAARDGRWGKGGAGGNFVCYTITSDAARSCTAAGDCEGHCLARSRTCAPLTPVFGCTEVLSSLGTASTLCVD